MPEYRFPAAVPKEAVAFLEGKGLKPSFTYLDVFREEHVGSFAAAGAMKLDVLRELHGSLVQALEEGIPYDQWRRNLQPKLAELGWWGEVQVVDKTTGETRDIEVTPRRLQRIYETNLGQARAAGAWQRYERTKRALPYLLYQLGPSQHHREQHESWAGTLLPVDHPWLDTHAPKNGYGCKCWLRQVSRAEAKRLGGETQAPAVEYREWYNPKTRKTVQVPKGIDPGFDYNPGKVPRPEQARRVLTDKADASPAPLAAAAVREQVQSEAFEQWYKAPKGNHPIAVIEEEHAQRVGAVTQTALFSADSAAKQVRHHPELTAADYAWVQASADRGEARQEGDHVLAYILEAEGWVAIVKATADGDELYLTSFRRLSGDEVKKDEELRRLRRKGVLIREAK